MDEIWADFVLTIAVINNIVRHFGMVLAVNRSIIDHLWFIENNSVNASSRVLHLFSVIV